jgi:hypothetical protein
VRLFLETKMKSILKCRATRVSFFLLLFLGVSFPWRLEGEAVRKPVLAILPFFIERVEEPGRGAICPVCKRVYRSGEILPSSPNTLTRVLHQKMEAIGTFEVLSEEEVEKIFFHQDLRRFEEKPVSSSLQVGKELNADFVFVGYVFRFEQRIGSSIGVEKPASVAFDIHLFRMRDGKMVWERGMDETQRPLSENLLKVVSFFRRKASWLKAEELASVGIDEMLRDLPGVKELEEVP